MNLLEGKHIRLRALEPTDLAYLYELENDDAVWEISHTIAPYSKYILKQYLDNAHKDLFEAKQLRLVIEVVENSAVIGFVDLFDFDPKHKRAGVGIVVFSEQERRKGYASEVLEILKDYAKKTIGLHQLFANISEENKGSIQLFEKTGFQLSGTKKDWLYSQGSYKNELLFQLILNDSE